jgi:hypothetical protein
MGADAQAGDDEVGHLLNVGVSVEKAVEFVERSREGPQGEGRFCPVGHEEEQSTGTHRSDLAGRSQTFEQNVENSDLRAKDRALDIGKSRRGFHSFTAHELAELGVAMRDNEKGAKEFSQLVEVPAAHGPSLAFESNVVCETGKGVIDRAIEEGLLRGEALTEGAVAETKLRAQRTK